MKITGNNQQSTSFGSTLAIWKPDATKRGLVKPLNNLLKENGFEILQSWQGKAPIEKLEKHYAEHQGKSFFNELINSMREGDIFVAEIEKKNSPDDVKEYRDLVKNVIRPTYAVDLTRNTAHSSSDKMSALQEIKLWFGEILGK